MVKKWIQGFIKHPFRIIKSIWYRLTNKNEELATLRLDVCNKCNNRLYINRIGDVCNDCGCILKNKARIKNEQCNKWL